MDRPNGSWSSLWVGGVQVCPLMARGDGPVFVEAGRITRDELQLTTRNHGMPLEALRYPMTPVGLHYLLVHYDIVDVDSERWRLEVDGAVARPLRLSLDDLRAR